MSEFFAELSKVANAYPHSLALISKTGNLDYRSLVDIIDNIAGHAAADGIGDGQIAHVEAENDDTRLLLFLGLMRAGASVALLHSAGLALAETGVVPDVVVTSRSDKSSLAKRAKRVVRYSRDWLRPDRTSQRRAPESPDYAVLFASSGSTGRQKLICERRSVINFNIFNVLDHPFFANSCRILTGVGETSHGTFPNYLPVLLNCGSIIRLQDYLPNNIVAATCLLRPSFAKFAPATLIEVLKVLDAEPRRFRKVDFLNLSGAYCDPVIREAALARYADRVFTTYGSTETSYIALGEFSEIGSIEGSVGRIFKGVTVETVDEYRNPLPNGAEGEIRVRPSARGATSYVTRDGPADVLEDGWFYPGDIGRVDASGQLIITGRKSAIINLGGNSINPEIVESALVGLAGVDDVAVAAVRSEYGIQAICALVVTNERMDLEEINRILKSKRVKFTIDRLKVVPEIPRGQNRKIDRPAVQAIADSI